MAERRFWRRSFLGRPSIYKRASLRSCTLSKYWENYWAGRQLTSAVRTRNRLAIYRRSNFKWNFCLLSTKEPITIALTTAYLNDNLITFVNISDFFAFNLTTEMEWNGNRKKRRFKYRTGYLGLTHFTVGIHKCAAFTVRCFNRGNTNAVTVIDGILYLYTVTQARTDNTTTHTLSVLTRPHSSLAFLSLSLLLCCVQCGLR